MAITFGKFPGSIFWRAKAREAVEQAGVWKMFDNNLIFRGTFIGNAIDPSDIDHRIIYAKNWQIIKTVLSVSEVESGYIGESLWTCNCPQNFLKSKLYLFCHKCGTSADNHSNKFKHYSDVLHWDEFILDGSTYKLPDDDHLI